MLIKAHRCRRPVDIYNVAAPILKTLITEANSHRSRGIKPGERSIYDELHDERARIQLSDPTRKFKQDIPQSLFYNEMDALEDEILFPEEHQGEDSSIPVGQSTNLLEQFERHGQLNPMRFALDLDTDEELSDEDKDGESITHETTDEVSSDENNCHIYDSGIDHAPSGEKRSHVNTGEGLTGREEFPLRASKHPVATICDELNIPLEDDFSAAMCRELAIFDDRYTKSMTLAEKIAFKAIHAQSKAALFIGVGPFSASTVPEMRKKYERSMARESSKCK